MVLNIGRQLAFLVGCYCAILPGSIDDLIESGEKENHFEGFICADGSDNPFYGPEPEFATNGRVGWG